jgi:hypothetical protein
VIAIDAKIQVIVFNVNKVLIYLLIQIFVQGLVFKVILDKHLLEAVNLVNLIALNAHMNIVFNVHIIIVFGVVIVGKDVLNYIYGQIIIQD